MTPMVGWVTMAEAAQYASVSKKTISRWTRDGLKCARMTTHVVRIKLADLYAYIERFCSHHVDVDTEVEVAMSKARKKLKEMNLK